MKIRAKLMLVIVGVMGVYFLLAALMLESRHLSRLHSRRNDLERYVRCAIAYSATPEEAATQLHRLAGFGYVREWLVEDPNGTEGGEGLASAGGGSLADGSGPLVVHLGAGQGESAFRIHARLRDASQTGLDSDLQALFIATVFGAGLLALTVYLLISRMILAPVDEMLLATHRLASGTTPMPLRLASRSDEIGRLAAAFESMSREVRETREHLETRVREATERVKVAERELAFNDRLVSTGRLAAGVAHEINNPLGGVMNALSRLRRTDLAAGKREEYLDLATDGLERIRQIVQTILHFARSRPAVEVLDPAVPLGRALDLCRHRMAGQGIELLCPAASEPVRVRLDGGELQQVFLNLLTNAIDALPEGGRLEIRQRREDDGVMVEIADSGPGMTPQEISASFDYFHTTKPAGRGTGLGLSISHDIVTRFGGCLRLGSRPGEGTTAQVWLPLATETADGGGE